MLLESRSGGMYRPMIVPHLLIPLTSVMPPLFTSRTMGVTVVLCARIPSNTVKPHPTLAPWSLRAVSALVPLTWVTEPFAHRIRPRVVPTLVAPTIVPKSLIPRGSMNTGVPSESVSVVCSEMKLNVQSACVCACVAKGNSNETRASNGAPSMDRIKLTSWAPSREPTNYARSCIAVNLSALAHFLHSVQGLGHLSDTEDSRTVN